VGKLGISLRAGKISLEALEAGGKRAY